MAALDLDRAQWQQLKAVLTTALKLPPAERVAMLGRVLAHDAVLRDYAIDMLQYYDTATRPFDTVNGGGADDTRAGATPRLAPAAGQSVGHYRVVRKLGEGGMGVVYLAEDERLGRQVALKVLSPAMRGAGAPTKAQLLAEARSAAVLNHAGIMTLHDVFEHDGELVTVMEYVEGRPLSDLIALEPTPLGFTLRLTCQLADALAYAHGRGIIHCDLKPANIHVLPNGLPKILDFGLARAIATSAVPDRPADAPLFGTPGYLAPEQLLGREATAAGDVYALGVIFYQLLTSLPPFRTDDPGQLFLDTITATPLPPSTHVPGIPPEVDQLALRCLAKSGRERLQPHELSRALNNILLKLEPVPELPSTRPRWHERIVSGLYAAAAIAGVVTLMGLAASISYNQPLGLSGAFATESAWEWPIWGARSLVAVAGGAAIISVLLLTGRSACQLALATIGPLRRLCQPLSAMSKRARARIALWPSAGIASTLLVAQVLVVGAMTWRFRSLLGALNSFVLGGPDPLDALGLLNRPDHRLLGELLTLVVFVFGVGWYQVWRQARNRGERDARAMIRAGVVLTVCSALVFQAMPFRILFHSRGERVSYRSERCYAVGQRGEDAVLFCPHRPPPRVQIVKTTDPTLRREGVVESIFSGFGVAPSGVE
jgi:serine/threonine-protein kinase